MKSLVTSSLRMLLGLLCVVQTSMGQTTCNGILAPNSVNNGDFGTGQTDFLPNDPFYAPDLTYLAAMPAADGTYTVSKFADNSANTCWLNISATDGYMLLANSDETPAIIYTRNIEVCDGIDYHFSAELLNLISPACASEALPIVELLIDDQLVASTEGLLQNGAWQTLSGAIQITPETDFVTLALRSVGVANSSNDIAVDNIRLQHCAPEITLPSVTAFCAESGLLISPNLDNMNYGNPHYQWQQSFDGGTTWQDLVDENSATLFLDNPIAGLQCRVQAANGPVNFMNENCRTISTATVLQQQTPVEIYRTPTICNGDTIFIGNESIMSAGNYTTIIGGDSGCDSLIHSQVFVYPSFDQLYAVSLCSGDLFEGQAYQADTVLQKIFTTQNGCDSIISVEIDVAENQDLAILGNTLLCADESTILAVSGTYTTYEWSTGETTNSIETAAAGVYFVTTTNSQGCEIIAEETIEISAPYFEVSTMNTSCPGTSDGTASITLQGGGIEPFLYSIDGENWLAASVFQNLNAGNHTVFLQDAAGCEESQAINITEGEEDFEVTILGLPNAAVDVGDTLQVSVSPFNNDYEYQWAGQGIFECRNCPTTDWFPLQEGELSLTVISPSGCSRQIDTLIDLRDQFRVYFPTAFSPNGDGQNDTFSLGTGTNVKQVAALEIYDRWGGQIYAKTTTDTVLPAWDGTWRGELLEDGIYLYRAAIEFKNGRTKTFAGEIQLMR